jgi:hypothetical protein
MRAVRKYWQGVQGRTALNMNWDAIDNDSVVLVTAAEYAPNAQDPGRSPRFVGSATVVVRNITPHGPPYDPNHGVTFVVDAQWGAPLNIVTDIVVVEKADVVDVGWRRLGFTMQNQQQTNWCWCANAVSVGNFYGDSWTQGALADVVLGQTTCQVNGGSSVCNVQHGAADALTHAGHLNSFTATQPTFATIQTEIDGGRPMSARIEWAGGGGHVVAIDGYLENTEFITVHDPGGTVTDIRLSTFLSAYQGTGTVTHHYLTQR